MGVLRMKTRQERKTLTGRSQTLIKRDTKRDGQMKKTLKEMKRQSGEEFYFIEGSCFDYCC
jgi:hypothetical protein